MAVKEWWESVFIMVETVSSSVVEKIHNWLDFSLHSTVPNAKLDLTMGLVVLENYESYLRESFNEASLPI